MLFKLVKSGYGDALTLLNTPTDIVVGMLHYDNFINEYQVQQLEMMKK